MKFFYIILFLFLFFSCKKNTEYDQYEMLTKAPWKLVSIMDKGKETIDSCEFDDVYTFGPEKLYIDDGNLKCLLDGDQYEPAKWKLKKGGQIITIPKIIAADNYSSGVHVIEKCEIIELNDSIFKVKWENFDYYKTFKR